MSPQTPAELRKYRVDPLALGRPLPASEMPRDSRSPPYARRLVMDAGHEQRHRPGATAASPMSVSPPPSRASKVDAKWKMGGSAARLDKFPW